MNMERVSAPQGVILLVDDDSCLRQALRVNLSLLGFTIVEATRGEEALSLIRLSRFDAVVLDADIPGICGLEACRSIRRANPQLAILFMTASDVENSKVLALDAGADDCISKPFQVRELTERLRSAVRRGKAKSESRNATIRHGQFELDQAKHRVLKRGIPLHLTRREFKLLRQLMLSVGKSVSHTQLSNAVWGPDCGKRIESLRMIVSQLREKIEDDPLNQRYLGTVHHVGYRFNYRKPAI
ncbi:MAG: response regulator transcription factor [Terracidiphilus sp.]|jgi:two-component system KDP operon response regulator KdpE